MLQYKAGYKFVGDEVHAQVLDFPAAIALVDVAEAAMELGAPLPVPNPLETNSEMDIEEPIYLHLHVSSDVQQVPAGVVVP